MHNEKLTAALNATMALPSSTGSPMTKLKKVKVFGVDPRTANSQIKSHMGKTTFNSTV